MQSFTEIVLPLENNIKKDNTFKWNYLENKYFSFMKQAIIDAPTLLSLNCDK